MNANETLALFKIAGEEQSIEMWRAEQRPGVKRQMTRIFNQRFNPSRSPNEVAPSEQPR